MITRLLTLTLILIAIPIATTTAAPLDVGVHNDTAITMTYTGSWSQQPSTAAYGGYYSLSTATSDVITFQTYATGFTVYFIYSPTGDTVDICIDSDCTTFSTIGAEARGVAEFTGLAYGLKTVTLSKATADSSGFGFDAVYIHPESEEISHADNISYVDFTYDGASYTGVIDTSLTSGDIAIILLLAVVLMISLADLVVKLWR